MGDDHEGEERERLVLVARKGRSGLPTACPSCLPVYLYLRFANASFGLEFDRSFPDSDHIPYVELGDYVAYNNEKGGVIEGLKEDKIVNLDSKLSSQSLPDWLSAKAMISSWLSDAALYELWVASDGTVADEIYFSDLPWPIGRALHWKQSRDVKDHFGITKINAAEKEEEIYRKAATAYEALSLTLGEDTFFFENRPTSLDALFLGHALFVLYTSSETSMLRNHLLKHENLVTYAENLKREFLEASSSSSSVPKSPFNPSASSTSRRGAYSHPNFKSKTKTKRERTEEEKTFRRRAKFFLATQLVSVLVFLTLLGGSDRGIELEMDDGDDGSLVYE